MDERHCTIEMLHRKYAGVLYDKSLRILGDTGDAEDAVQETFVSAHRTLHRFRYGDSHLPWLLGAVAPLSAAEATQPAHGFR